MIELSLVEAEEVLEEEYLDSFSFCVSEFCSPVSANRAARQKTNGCGWISNYRIVFSPKSI